MGIEPSRLTSGAAGFAPREVFMTGASGFVGQELLAGLLERFPRARFRLLLRPRTRAGREVSAAERLLALAGRLTAESGVAPESLEGRLAAVPGDLAADRFGLPRDDYENFAATVDAVVHCAADVDLWADYPQVRETNLEGTRRCLSLAAAAAGRGDFKRFIHVSTAFVKGRREGTIAEAELDCGQEFVNPYERSKLEAELEVRKFAEVFPAVVLRPSMVLGDSRTGRIRDYRSVINPIFPLLFFGKIPLGPHAAGTAIDAVPVDYVRAAAVHLSGLADAQVAGRTFHLTAGPGKSLSMSEIAVEALRLMREFHPEGPAGRGYRTPRDATMEDLAEEARRNPRLGLLLRPYLRILSDYTDRPYRFDDGRAAALLGPAGIAAPAVLSYLPNIVRYGIGVAFGRKGARRS